jgi:hypothetical protein
LLEGLGTALELTGENVGARQALLAALAHMSGRELLIAARLQRRVGDTFKSQGDYTKRWRTIRSSAISTASPRRNLAWVLRAYGAANSKPRNKTS